LIRRLQRMAAAIHACDEPDATRHPFDRNAIELRADGPAT
jgi:hypothetical protein